MANNMFLSLIKNLFYQFFQKGRFSTSKEYWINRYRKGGNSGLGSFNKLAQNKAKVINDFVASSPIESIIEFGCGDGNQLRLANYPKYTGYDISYDAIQSCRRMFSRDPSKEFYLLEDYDGRTADLCLSLDVIFHLIENEAFNSHLHQLFESSNKYVIIYSSNTSDNSLNHSMHVKHRKFSEWVETYLPNWKLMKRIPNLYPSKNYPVTGSFSDFYIYVRSGVTFVSSNKELRSPVRIR